MPRLSTNPDDADRARRDEIRLRELDRTNRRALDALGETNLVARHRWSGGGNVTANADGPLNLAGHWAVARDDGIAQFVPDDGGFSVPGFYLNRPGRWAITLAVYSDAAFAGTMRVTLQQATPGDMFDGAGRLQVTQPRVTGYSGAGFLDQLITWSGAVTEAEAVNPLLVVLRHITPGTGLAPSTWWFQANYLGSGTWPAETVIPPVANVPQDDAAAGTTSSG